MREKQIKHLIMEMLDIVDQNDNAVSVAAKADIYKNNLCHRIAHVMVFTSEGKMLLQKRSKQVTFCPDHWSTAVGGHVQAGENYEEAAIREYAEELGTGSALRFVGKDYYVAANTPPKFVATFETLCDGPFAPDAEVISEIALFSLEEIKKMFESGMKFHPELLFILKKYYL